LYLQIALKPELFDILRNAEMFVNEKKIRGYWYD